MIHTHRLVRGSGGQVSFEALLIHKGQTYRVSKGHVTARLAEREARLQKQTVERLIVRELQKRQV